MQDSSVSVAIIRPALISRHLQPLTEDGVPELLETSDFLLFRFITLNGP